MNSLNAISEQEMLRVINHTAMFAGVGLNEQHLLVYKSAIVHRNQDEVIIEQGAVGDTLYVIIKGRVLVSKHTTNGWVRMAILGPKDVFGEIAILRNIPRTARITTQTPCTFLTINAKDFLNVYQYFSAQSRDNIQLIVAKRLAHGAHSM